MQLKLIAANYDWKARWPDVHTHRHDQHHQQKQQQQRTIVIASHQQSGNPLIDIDLKLKEAKQIIDNTDSIVLSRLRIYRVQMGQSLQFDNLYPK